MSYTLQVLGPVLCSQNISEKTVVVLSQASVPYRKAKMVMIHSTKNLNLEKSWSRWSHFSSPQIPHLQNEVKTSALISHRAAVEDQMT